MVVDERVEPLPCGCLRITSTLESWSRYQIDLSTGQVLPQRIERSTQVRISPRISCQDGHGLRRPSFQNLVGPLPS